jgi:transposase
LTSPSPVDRARTASKHHLLTDTNGVPLAVSVTGAHRNDVTQLLPLIDGVEPVRKVGRPRRSAKRLLADRGYDHDKYRRELWARGVKPVIARRQREHGSGLGRERWVVERGFSRGCITSGACGPATSGSASSTRRSSSSAARSSASGCFAGPNRLLVELELLGGLPPVLIGDPAPSPRRDRPLGQRPGAVFLARIGLLLEHLAAVAANGPRSRT